MAPVLEKTKPSINHLIFEPSSRWIRANKAGEIIEDVDSSYLEAATTLTHCQYKGDASYYHLLVNGVRYDNTVWAYPEPLREALNLAGTLCFWPAKDSRSRVVLIVDGEMVA